MTSIASLGMLAAGALLLYLLFRLIKAPFKLLMKLLINMALGFVGLIIVNLLGSYVHISLTLNWLNALVAGILGVPGVILLLLIKYLL